jgi:O-antigen ligase
MRIRRNIPAGPEQPVRDLVSQIAFWVDVLVLFFLATYLMVRPLVLQADLNQGTLGSDALAKVLIVTAALLWMLRSNLLGGLQAAVCGAELAWAALISWAMLASAIWANDQLGAWLRTSDWLCDGLAFWLALQVARHAAGARFLLRVLLATALVTAVYGIYQYAIGFELVRRAAATKQWIEQLPVEQRVAAQERVDSNRIYASFAIANHYAAYLALMIPLAGSLILGGRYLLLRFSAALLLGVLSSALLLTGSKGAWLALCAAFACWLITRRHAVRRYITPMVSAGTLLLVLFLLLAYRVGPFAALRERLGDVFPTQRVLGATTQVRLEYWQGALAALYGEPRLLLHGAGPEQFRGRYHRWRAEHATETRHAHNDYLELLVDLGLIGLLTYLVFLALIGRTIWRGLRQAHALGNAPADAAAEEHADPITADVLRFSPLIYLAVGVAGFMLLGSLDSSFQLPEVAEGSRINWPGIFYGSAAMIWLVAGLAILPGSGAATLPALAVGLVAFAFHSAVDFDLYVSQLSSMAFTLAGIGCGLALQQQRRARLVVNFPLVGQLAAGILLLPPFYLLTNVYLHRAIRFDAKIEEARRAISEKAPGRAIQALDEAIAEIPWHAPTLLRLAELENDGALSVRHATSVQQFESANASRMTELGRSGPLDLLERAVALDPYLTHGWGELGRWHEAYAALHAREQRAFPPTAARHQQLNEHVVLGRALAARAYAAALHHYPHHPEHHYQLGMLLRQLEDRELILIELSWPWPGSHAPTPSAKVERRGQLFRLVLEPLAARLRHEPRIEMLGRQGRYNGLTLALAVQTGEAAAATTAATAALSDLRTATEPVAAALDALASEAILPLIDSYDQGTLRLIVGAGAARDALGRTSVEQAERAERKLQQHLGVVPKRSVVDEGQIVLELTLPSNTTRRTLLASTINIVAHGARWRYHLERAGELHRQRSDRDHLKLTAVQLQELTHALLPR